MSLKIEDQCRKILKFLNSKNLRVIIFEKIIPCVRNSNSVQIEFDFGSAHSHKAERLK